MHQNIHAQLPASTEPTIIGMSASGKYYYGITRNIIYKKRVGKDKWKQQQQLSMSPVISTLTYNSDKNEIAFRMGNDSIYHVNINNGETRVIRIGEYLSRFQEHPVSRLIFSIGSHGCFHQYSDNLEYEREGDEFVLTDKKSAGMNHKNRMGTSKGIVPADEVTRLQKALCNDYSRMPRISDLGFTQQEYDQCKKDIQAFAVDRKVDGNPGKIGFYITGNNVDFNRLSLLVDSIETIDTAAIGEILQHAGLVSTTVDWMAISLVSDNGEELHIRYHYFEDPNAMRLPCVLMFNDEVLRTFTPEIPRFLDRNCPALMKDKNRMPLLYAMVNYLYARKIE
ncbi:MAG: hypothetical protein J7623_17010 [Chitinophaga sp.]|uniref:hypothetical protein n=1 Tax=Chitinophaga sp. TaxID=1869181 RepID=UPI001B1D5FA2|nr:hypothetical protein [Chitinophaga sp.]MBO9730343.1 hypothetical protein [Chitinophaga sp.]